MAVYKNPVIPRPKGKADVDMSLKAAEKARRASEDFVRKVNEMIPEDPQKCHKNLLKGIDGKLALLKKNVAYLVLQNLTLIDKLMDAENTVHQVRSLHELRKKWKDRPNTFAAPETSSENDYTKHSDRTKCESWCNPSTDFLLFNENSSDLQSRKLSLTDKFLTNRLRQYIIREDMINFLEPHLASFLFSNQCKEKDSDNDSGTGEEIVSPDEFETTNKFDPLNCPSSIVTSSNKLEDFVVTPKLSKGNFSVICSKGMVAEKSGDKVIGIVHGVKLDSDEEIGGQETGTPKKVNNNDVALNTTIEDMSANRHVGTSLGEEFKRRGFAAIGNTFSEEKTITTTTTTTTTNEISNESFSTKTNLNNEPSQTDNSSTKDKGVDTKRNERYSSIRGQFEKKDSVSSTHQIEKKQATPQFTRKEKVPIPGSGSGILQGRFQDDSVILRHGNEDSTPRKYGSVLQKSASLNYGSESSIYSNPSKYGQGYRNVTGLARTPSISENDDNDDSKYISIDRRESFSTTSIDRKNFSSKVNRGNKLRKSKRVEDTHRLFESNLFNKSEKHQKPDPTLRYAGSIHKNPFSEGKVQGSRCSPNKYTPTLRQSDKFLSTNSQGDLAGP